MQSTKEGESIRAKSLEKKKKINPESLHFHTSLMSLHPEATKSQCRRICRNKKHVKE
ncbi:unnamed protein product [Arabidopsis halleri]